MGAPQRPPATRLEWLDLYRGLAVLVMIETHVSNTFLLTAHWPVEWRVRLDYVNGLVAPAFLFIAGFAYGCGLRRKRSVRTHARARLVHLAGIAAIGYAMHIPWAELSAGRWGEALMLGTRMDILPCLAFSIAALVVVDRFFEKTGKVIVTGLVIGIILLAHPATQWTQGPPPLLAIVNQNSGSLFPLLPWAAFTFCGFLVSDVGAMSLRRSVAAVLAPLTAAVMLGARGEVSSASMAFFFQRLAWIILLVPVCRGVAMRWSPRVVLFAGRESLAIYVVHLLIISHLVMLGLPQMNLVPVGALLLAVLAATFAVAWAWRRFTVARADRARRAAHLPESSARPA